MLIAISVVHIAMGNLYDDVYDPNNGALYLYLLYVFLHTCIVLYRFFTGSFIFFHLQELKTWQKTHSLMVCMSVNMMQ